MRGEGSWDNGLAESGQGREKEKLELDSLFLVWHWPAHFPCLPGVAGTLKWHTSHPWQAVMALVCRLGLAVRSCPRFLWLVASGLGPDEDPCGVPGPLCGGGRPYWLARYRGLPSFSSAAMIFRQATLNQARSPFPVTGGCVPVLACRNLVHVELTSLRE